VKKMVIVALCVALMSVAIPLSTYDSSSDDASKEQASIENYVNEFGIVNYIDNYGTEKLEKYCSEQYVMEQLGSSIVNFDCDTSYKVITISYVPETDSFVANFDDTLDKGRVGKEHWEQGGQAGYYIYLDSVTMNALVEVGPAGAGAIITGAVTAMFGGTPVGAVIGAFVGVIIGGVISDIIKDNIDISNGWVFKVAVYSIHWLFGHKIVLPKDPVLIDSYSQ